MNLAPFGVLADRDLRAQFDVCSVVVYDWAHSCLQDGVVTLDCFCMLRAAGEIGVTPASLRAYLQLDWQWPSAAKSKATKLYQVFDSCRAPDADRLKCSSSEHNACNGPPYLLVLTPQPGLMGGKTSYRTGSDTYCKRWSSVKQELLQLYGMMRSYFSVQCQGAPPAVMAAMASFERACEIVDIVQKAKRAKVGLFRERCDRMDCRMLGTEKGSVYGSRRRQLY